MGDRWWLRQGDTQIQWNKNDEPAQLLSVFSEQDKYLDQRWAQLDREHKARDEDDAPSEEYEDYLGQRDNRNLIGYRAPVSAVVDRLNLMGYTAEDCRHELIEMIKFLNDEQDTVEIQSSPRVQGSAAQYLDMPASEVLERALAAFLVAQNQGSKSLDLIAEGCLNQLDFLDGDWDPRILLAVQLENADPNELLELDLHDLFYAGYFDNVDEIASLASEQLSDQLASTGPIIVVTEGKSDAEFLQYALSATAPTVCHHFRFLDFDSKVEGGGDQVVRILRSFSAAGVMNRVIGVLDNDVAGHKATAQLRTSNLMPSIRYLTLPDVAYGESYPTLGPEGEGHFDINGRAVSVEFMFGLEALLSRDGNPVPVRWTGFDAGQNAWQGALVDKKLVQENVRNFTKTPIPNLDHASDAWVAMSAFSSSLISAATPATFPGQAFRRPTSPLVPTS